MIPLGYEIGTGRRVSIPRGHTIVLGQTQKSGKTTTLEAMTARSGVKAIAFITKRGEKSFRNAYTIPPYYSETSETQPYWQFVVSIIESSQDVRLGFREKGWVMELCTASGLNYSTETEGGKKKKHSATWKEPKALREVLTNAELALKHSKGISKMICRQLVEYLKVAVPEIERAKLSNSLELKPGINVMDISTLSLPVQMLIIRSVLEWCIRRRKIVVIIPEAWKFLPEGHTTPVSGPAIAFIREGAVNENFMWIDLQDLRGIQKMLLRSVQVWLFGVQREKNEVENTLRSMPTPECKPTAQEMMQLKIGQFLVAYDTEIYRTYVQPAGMEDVHAQAIARGEERPESWPAIAASLDEEESPRENASLAHEQESTGNSDDQPAAQQPDQPAAGSARVAESDPARLAEDSNPEDPVWREKHETFLKEVHQPLVEAHDALAERVRKLEGKSPSQTSAAHPAGKAASVEALPGVPRSAASENGAGQCGEECSAPDLDRVYRYVLERASKEQPSTLAVLLERPEIEVRFERKQIAVDGKTVMGGVASLIAKGFFDRPINPTSVQKELRRLGYSFDNKSVPKRLSEAVAQGFLTREEGGEFLVVAGMKINIVEVPA